MRYNMFNDPYCHDAAEIAQVLSDKGVLTDEINADFSFDEDEDGWSGEIRMNEGGETVCFFEGFASAHEVRVTLMDAGLAAGDISEL